MAPKIRIKHTATIETTGALPEDRRLTVTQGWNRKEVQVEVIRLDLYAEVNLVEGKIFYNCTLHTAKVKKDGGLYITTDGAPVLGQYGFRHMVESKERGADPVGELAAWATETNVFGQYEEFVAYCEAYLRDNKGGAW